MNKKQVLLAAIFSLLFPAIGVISALANGDKIIPQVADGIGGDGTIFRTKFDLINLGPDKSTPITKTKVLFFKGDGTPWRVATNQGTVSEVTLNLGPFQTFRIETSGTTSPQTSGYAIIRSVEPTTIYSEDYELGISVFYEIKKGNDVIDTISVPTGQPTVVWVFPAEIDTAKNLLTGFAVVNLSTKLNSITLQLWKATTPSSGDPTDSGKATIKLNPSEQRAIFLVDKSLYPNLSTFKGMVLGTSEEPVSILALLQTPTPTGPQYATLVPTYADALRRNTFMYLRQGYPLDADIPIVDYYGNKVDRAPWDLLYETQSASARRLVPQPGAAAAVIGSRTDKQFDDEVTLSYLQGLTYKTDPIDLSNNSANLQSGIAIAVRTGLGRYVKLRIGDLITRGTEYDLALEIYVYK